MKRILILFTALLFAFSSSAYAKSAAASLQEMYAEAEFLMVQGDYAGAASKFEAMGAYSDASQMAMYCKAVSAAETTGLYIVAVDALTDLGDFKDSKQLAVYYTARSYEASGDVVDWDNISSASDDALEQAREDLTSASGIYAELALFKDCLTRMNSCDTKAQAIEDEQKVRRDAFVEKRRTALALSAHFVGVSDDLIGRLRDDGTVALISDDEELLRTVSSWQNIVAISSSFDHFIGLKADGTVVAAGKNQYGQCNIEDWQDIAAVSSGYGWTVGLKTDGTVVAVGKNQLEQCNVESWRNIVAISTGLSHTVGLKANGSVVAAGWVKDMCNVSGWRDIVAIAAGWNHTVGLKADGTVVSTRISAEYADNDYGQCDVSSWQNIVAISADMYHTVGLKADGTVVAVGHNKMGECNVEGWQNIIAIIAVPGITYGLKADGTVVSTSQDISTSELTNIATIPMNSN